MAIVAGGGRGKIVGNGDGFELAFKADANGVDTSTAAASGLGVDLRGRRLLVHQAAGFAESGMAVSVSYDPSPDTPLGLTARVAPSWGARP